MYMVILGQKQMSLTVNQHYPDRARSTRTVSKFVILHADIHTTNSEDSEHTTQYAQQDAGVYENDIVVYVL